MEPIVKRYELIGTYDYRDTHGVWEGDLTLQRDGRLVGIVRDDNTGAGDYSSARKKLVAGLIDDADRIVLVKITPGLQRGAGSLDSFPLVWFTRQYNEAGLTIQRGNFWFSSHGPVAPFEQLLYQNGVDTVADCFRRIKTSSFRDFFSNSWRNHDLFGLVDEQTGTYQLRRVS